MWKDTSRIRRAIESDLSAARLLLCPITETEADEIVILEVSPRRTRLSDGCPTSPA
jgi:hypothetical protein